MRQHLSTNCCGPSVKSHSLHSSSISHLFSPDVFVLFAGGEYLEMEQQQEGVQVEEEGKEREQETQLVEPEQEQLQHVDPDGPSPGW